MKRIFFFKVGMTQIRFFRNEKRLELNASRSCFWDCYWGRPFRYWRICFPCPQQQSQKCERFEPRSHFISRLSMIVRVIVVLNRTVVVDSDWRFDNPCGSHLQSQSGVVSCQLMVFEKLWVLTWLVNKVTMLLVASPAVKPWCYWLWSPRSLREN